MSTMTIARPTNRKAAELAQYELFAAWGGNAAAVRRARAVQKQIKKATGLAGAQPVNGLQDLLNENALSFSDRGRRTFRADFTHGDLVFAVEVSARTYDHFEKEDVSVYFSMVTGTHEDGTRERSAYIYDGTDFVVALAERDDFVPRRIPVLRRLLSQLRGR